MKRTSREPSNLSESLRRQLNVYALAATTAGVGMSALATPAEAEIVYTPADKLIGLHQALPLDLNHDGKSDFRLRNGTSCGTDICFTSLSVKRAATGNGIEGYRGNAQWASALKKGTRIGPSGHFYSYGDMVILDYGSLHQSSPWAGVANRYLGVKFQIHGQTHYGWVRLDVGLTFGAPFSAFIAGRLTGYAYETIPNKAIIAGKTKGKDVITLQPASLGALAAGVNGLHTWR